MCVSAASQGHASLGGSPVEVSSDKVVYLLLGLGMEVLKFVEGTVWERSRGGSGSGRGRERVGGKREREREWEGKGGRVEGEGGERG